MPPEADSDILPAALVWPDRTRRPFACSVRSPACAAMSPALATPTPFSDETRKTLFAYIPPSWLTSIAMVGAGPLAAIGVAFSVL
ncbi:hypothetical protein X962_5986 [Burkholderia pseudomallei MSHR7343]|nr:hypothetical protein X962_5986 [Burkholderia pseudomallei MSHR7343]